MTKNKLIVSLYSVGAIKIGDFKLKIGSKPPFIYVTSPFLVDLRVLVSYPDLLHEVAKLFCQLLEKSNYDRLVALPYASMPITALISYINKKPWIYSRKEAKKYGTKKLVEGVFNKGERVVIIDDTVTTGVSIINLSNKLGRLGLRAMEAVIFIDRDEYGVELIKKKGIKIKSFINVYEVFDIFEKEGLITSAKNQELKNKHLSLKEYLLKKLR